MSESEAPANVVNLDEIEETSRFMGEHWGANYKPLTAAMKAGGGKLGINWMRVPKGKSTCPFHAHALEDEAFFVLSGRGVLRYGDELRELRAGDCVSCPAGTKVAHQLANPFDEDFVYLAIGNSEPHEVAIYPDNGKLLSRSFDRIGHLKDAEYLDGEPSTPRIFDLWDGQKAD